MNRAEPQVFIINLYREDHDFPIEYYASSDQKEAVAAYTKIVTEWKTSVQENRPMEVEFMTNKHLIITSFKPAYLREVKVEVLSATEYERLKNPLERQMQKEGFSAFTNKHFSTNQGM
jgi:hypothetical protein